MGKMARKICLFTRDQFWSGFEGMILLLRLDLGMWQFM